MNTVARAAQPPAQGIEVVQDPAALGGILAPDCGAAIWHRQPLPEVQAWLDDLNPAQLPRGRVIVPAGAVAAALAQIFDRADLPAGQERDWLWSDILQLSETFATLMKAPYLRVRLDVVTTNACRRFHIDAMTARLVCTYRGTGTQYGVAAPGQAPDTVFTVPTGAPIVLRGSKWEGAQTGVLHRSPPIEGTGETRLVLVLDPVFDPEGEV